MNDYDYVLGNDFVDADFPRIVKATHEAMTRPLTPEEVESFAYHPKSNSKPYKPSPADWAEYEAWDRAVQDHDNALQAWMSFFPDDEKSTYYVS